jgi:hypothetical protein
VHARDFRPKPSRNHPDLWKDGDLRGYGATVRDITSRLTEKVKAMARRWRRLPYYVVFTATDRDIARMDVARGPCVPLPGRKRPLVGPFGMMVGTPRDLEALFRISPARSNSPWALKETSGPGRLYVFDAAFSNWLAGLSEAYQFRPKDDPKSIEWTDHVLPNLVRRWADEIGSGEWRLPSWNIAGAAGSAKSAARKQQRLYAWFGPQAPLPLSPSLRKVAADAASKGGAREK